jgi:GT2 family glycosyltransferase
MVTASIVLYETKASEIKSLLDFIVKDYDQLSLTVIDNSKNNNIEEFISTYFKIKYIHNPSNPGFGAAHNIALTDALVSGAKYHFIINPDINIESDIFTPMITYMEQNPDVGMMMPKILNNDGSIQHLPKLLPSPTWIFRRKLKKVDPSHQKFIKKYELRDFADNYIINVPILSGCFSLCRLDAIKQIGMYDERYFMYFEDNDLSRRMHQKYKTIYFPEVSVYHGYEGGANKSFKLFKIFIKSMISYFNKWGWFLDKDREHINRLAFEQVSFLNLQ